MKRIIAFLLLSTITYGQQRPESPLPPGTPGTVTLPLAEYDLLIERAALKPKPPEAAPLPFVLSRSAFKVSLVNDIISGTLDMDGEVLHKGPTKVPLTNGLTILEARQTGRPLPLIQEGPTHAAVLAGPSSFSVSMNVAIALSVEPGRASFSLPVPATGNAQLLLDIPGNHVNVRIEPGLVTRRETSGGHTIVEATLQPGRPARAWWTTREAIAPVAQREVRYLSDIKTLISVGDSQVRSAAICDVTVIQGEPAELKVAVPAGFEVTDATGSTLVSSEAQSGTLILRVNEPARRNHQFLVALERSSQDRKLDGPLLSFMDAQRETAEVLVEGVGAMELTATEGGGLRRIDVREASPVFRSLTRHPLQAAFRYHRRPGDTPSLGLEWNQFPDSSVLSAIAERAIVTTLLNVEGKSLTEITLRIRNHAQSFMKVELPQGASLLSAEVEGEKVKPVQGTDGNRVPLLRAGFRPSGAYTVSFVILSSGAVFGKKGPYELGIPKLDIPVSLLSWEVFLPERLEVKQFGGNAISASFLPAGASDLLASNIGEADDAGSKTGVLEERSDIANLQPGQIGGIVVDQQGAIVGGAKVTVTSADSGATQSTVTDSEGRWTAAGVKSGPVRVRVDNPGFKSSELQLDFDAARSFLASTTMEVGQVTETVTVQAAAGEGQLANRRMAQEVRRAQQAQLNAPSDNVSKLQRRVAGILPVQVDVPRAGRSYRFARPLVLNEETKVTFQYKVK